MSGVIFSLKNGEVWVSWPGSTDAVRLGEVDEVSAMMRDFLQQVELGERLNRTCGLPDKLAKDGCRGDSL